MSKCLLCATIFKNEGHLTKAFENIKKIKSLFNYFKIIISYDDSGDNSLRELCDLKQQGWDIDIIMNNTSRFHNPNCRPFNIARARNQILNKIYSEYMDYNYFIFADLDDVFTFDINIDILQKYLPKLEDINKVPNWDNINYQWDSLTFYNKYYYDTWAVSIDHLQESSWHREMDGWEAQREVLTYLKEVMDNLKTDMRPIDSAFNGFAIHRLDKFSGLTFKPLTLIKEDLIVDCEWRQYYKEANKKGLKVMISKDCLFDPMKDVIPELYNKN